MLNFYVISIGHDMVNALTVLLRAGANSKLHQKKQSYKMWSSFRKHGLHQITVWRFQTKNSKF